MIYVTLFLTFLKIGTFSFGGGYGMISLIRETVLEHGWLSEKELMDFIAVSESTPGPLAVNMATFIGSSQAGFLGGLVATIGVVLPAFFIILLLAAVMSGLSKNRYMNYVLDGVRPAVTAMILATAFLFSVSTICAVHSWRDSVSVDWKAGSILLLLISIHLICEKKWRKAPSPLLMILISAIIGAGVSLF